MRVREEFIERWGRIYLEKVAREGEKAGREWFRSFIPRADQPRVFKAIEDGRCRNE